jgi:hypothetical protein
LVQAILDMFPGAKLETTSSAPEPDLAPPANWDDFAPIDDELGDDE